MKKQILSAVIMAAVAASMSSCENAGSGALLGGAAGAGLGAIAGNNVDGLSKGEGALIGGAAGALIGGVQGNQQRQINQAQASAAAANNQVINLYNSNGSTSQVVLTRVPSGWQGPRGEVYTTIPSESQLRQAGYGF